MPEIITKSPEVIQAQIAAFAAERVEYFKDSSHILENLGKLAAEGFDDATRTIGSGEYLRDEAGGFVRLPEGTERTVATTSEYVDFLRSVNGSDYDSIQSRADLLKAYDSFAPTIDKLRQELSDPATRKSHPSFLGNGSNSMVFSISQEGKDYAVRVPNAKRPNPVVIDSHLGGAVLGRGIPHLEQIVAASYENGVTIAEIMPGKEVGDMTSDEITQITDEQLSQLIDTLQTVSERGIEIDPKPSNIFYDPESGFGIVDYHSSKVAGKSSADQDLGSIVGWMSTPIDNAGLYGKGYNPDKTIDDYARNLDLYAASLEVLGRYRRTVDNKLVGDDRQVALKFIDSSIQARQETIENYSNPEWVAKEIAQNEQRKQLIAEAGKPKAGLDGWDWV